MIKELTKGKANGKLESLIDKKFGELTVVEFYGRENFHYYWVCRCSCGNIVIYTSFMLKSGEKTHCNKCRWGKYSKNVRMERHLLRVCKNGAKSRKIEFLLTDDEFFNIIKQPCKYCGKFRCKRNNHTNEEHFIYSGVDRIDSSIGYLIDNCVPCCTYCNQAKNNRTESEFLEWVNELYEFQHRIQENVQFTS